MGIFITTPSVKKALLYIKPIEYIMLPRKYTLIDYLYHDVWNGAFIYHPCVQLGKVYRPRVCLITVRNREDGYRAVQYLEAVYARQEGHTEPVQEYQLPEIDPMDEFFCDATPLYDEHFSRIPILESGDVLSIDNYILEHSFSPRCAREALCIVEEDNYFFNDMFGGVHYDYISKELSNAIGSLSTPKRIYLLMITDHVNKEDGTLQAFLLDHKAMYFDLVSRYTESDYEQYHYNLFLKIIKDKEICLENDQEGPDIARMLEKIDPSRPCMIFQKTLDYVLRESDKTVKLSRRLLEEMEIIDSSEDREISENSSMIQMKMSKEIEMITEAFADLIGMEGIKKQLIEFYYQVQLDDIRQAKLGINKAEKKGYHFVLYGNPGTGKTAVARVIAKVLNSLGINEKDTLIEVDRAALVVPSIGGTARKVKEVLNSAKGGTLFIDEAYSLYKKDFEKDFGREAIDTLLKDMEDHRGEYSVILAGYKNEMKEMLNHANPGFRSRFNYHIEIPDYSDEDLIKIADRMAASHSYEIDDNGHRAIKKRILRERVDETFGNARFIRQIMEEAERHMATRLAEKLRLGEELTSEELKKITAEDFGEQLESEESLEDLLAQLNVLCGLKSVKQHVEELCDTIMYRKEAEKRGIHVGESFGALHMAFLGNPGTGKTTVARLLGKILAELDVLKRKDVFVEVNRADLIGEYMGHTALKVKEAVRSAMGGVLFIDEAYSLVQGERDMYGHEAVDTLIAEMENHRDSLVVILAGYTDELRAFLEINPGMKSRIKHELLFEDYSLEEMQEIFLHMVSTAGLELDSGLYPLVKQLLNEESAKVDFGNARGVRNVFENVKRRSESRVVKLLRSGQDIKDEDFKRIEESDLRL